jgi:hypothetical protein
MRETVLTEIIRMCCIKLSYLECIISVKHIYLLSSNYAYSDMFRLEGVIIRLFFEPYRTYIKYSAHFGILKSLHLKIQVKLLQY